MATLPPVVPRGGRTIDEEPDRLGVHQLGGRRGAAGSGQRQ